MKGSKLVPIAKAAKLLEISSDHPSLWLLRAIRQREADAGVRLLEPIGTGKKRPRFRVSLTRLRKHMPELFDHEAEAEPKVNAAATMLGRVLRKLETIDDRLDEQDGRLVSIHSTLRDRNRQK